LWSWVDLDAPHGSTQGAHGVSETNWPDWVQQGCVTSAKTERIQRPRPDRLVDRSRC
jgi:hypothetical protein